MNNLKHMNLETTVGYLVDIVGSGIKPIYIAAESDFPALITEANCGNYYIVNANKHLKYVTKSTDDTVVGIDLGVFPAQGPQGAQGEQGAPATITISNNSTWVINGVDTGLPSRGAQGAKGNDGITGRTGAGVGTVTDVDASAYTPTKATAGSYDTYTTTADIKYYEGTTLVTDTITLKFKVSTGGGTIPEVLTDLAEVIAVDAEGSVDFGHDVYADGALESGTDVTVGRNLYVDDITKIQDPDGNAIFPFLPPPSGSLNKVLMHKTTGESWEKVTYSSIDSGLATDGYVLTADGNGNAAWESVPGVSPRIIQDLTTQANPLINCSISNTDYLCGTITTVPCESVTVYSLPGSPSTNDTVTVNFYSGATATTFAVNDDDNPIVGTFTPSANSLCEVSFRYVLNKWVMVGHNTALEA